MGDESGAFGVRIRAHRLAAGFTQEQLAERAGLSAQAVGALERGDRRFPYRDTVTRLADALNLDKRQRDNLITAARRPRRPQPSTPLRTPRQLPAGPIRFVGRQPELAHVTAELRSPTGVSVHVIVGMGGIGKTSFALQVGHQVADRFPEGQVYVDLRGVASGEPMSPVDAMRRVVGAVGILPDEAPSAVDEAASWYRSALAGRRLLLVLDNASDAAQVTPLLPGAAGCGVIITSRTAMGGLASARQLTLEPLSLAEALDLLTTAAGEARLAAEPSESIEVVRLCGRHPLAVHLAGARLSARPDWPVSHLVQRLATEHGRLDALDMADVSVRASLAVSLDQLTASGARRDIQAASAFLLLGAAGHADFSTVLAGQVLGLPAHEASQVLERLADLHLLQASSPDRYRLHDLLRVFARERAAVLPDHERAAALDRVVDLFAAVAWRGLRLLWSSGMRRTWAEESWTATAPSFQDSTEAFEWLEDHRPHIVTTSAASAGHPHTRKELLARLALGIMPFYLSREYGADWVDICEHALCADVDPLTEALLRMDLGLALTSRASGDHLDALAHMHRSLAMLEQVGTPDHVVTCLTNITHICLVDEDLATGFEYGRRALQACRDMDSVSGEAMALMNLGLLHRAAGDHPQALVALERCVTMFEELNELHRAAAGLQAIGGILRAEGSPTFAAVQLRRSANLSAQVGDPLYQTAALEELGLVHLDVADTGMAATVLNEALSIARKHGLHRKEMSILNHLEKIAS